MAEMENNPKQLTRDEIMYLLKKIDRKLKNITSDPEIVGQPNQALQSLEDLPLTLHGVDNLINALGALSAHEIVNQLELKQESIGQRKIRYERLNEAQSHPEIAGALNIYADEATTEDKNGEIIHVLHPNKEVVNIVYNMFLRIGIYDKAWHIIRNMCGFGDEFYEIIISRDTKRILKIIPIPRECISRKERNGELIGFEINDTDTLNNQLFSYSINYPTKKENDEKLIYPFRILHFRIPSSKYGVYGEAVIDSVLSTIEQLQIMERALLIARVTRAPERRIFNIDVGTLQGEAAIKFTKQVMDTFRNKRRLDVFTKNKIDFSRDIFGVTEDIAIPKRAGTEGNRIDTLPQLADPNVEDLNWIRDKIFPGLGIPRQYLFDEAFANANLNLSSKSVTFAKRIRRIQRYFLTQLYKLAYIELRLQGYDKRTIEELIILMNNPSNIDEKERIELETAKWTLITQMKALNTDRVFIPDYIIYRDILKLSDNEIVEWLKLGQLQAANQNIFLAKPLEERPPGAEELVTLPQQPSEETETTQPTETGTEQIPKEVEQALGPPEEETGGTTTSPTKTPETAEYITSISGDKKPIFEVLNKKKQFLQKIKSKSQQFIFNESTNINNNINQNNNNYYNNNDNININSYKFTLKPTFSIEELEMDGNLRGFEEAYSDILKDNIIIKKYTID